MDRSEARTPSMVHHEKMPLQSDFQLNVEDPPSEPSARNAILSLLKQGNHPEALEQQQLASILWKMLSLPIQIRRQLLPVAVALLAMMNSGCMSAPNYRDSIRESAYDLTETEMTHRQRKFLELIKDPELVDRTPALQSGINDCQRDRMIHHSVFLFEQAQGNDFEDFLSLCGRARRTLGMMNFDRYSPEMIEQALNNYHNPDLLRDRDLVLVVMSREDHEQTIFDIQALNVESGRIEELTKAYKVILVETSHMSELLHHASYLERSGILRPGNLAGIVFGTHAESDSIEAGIDRDNAHMLASLDQFLAKDAPVVLAACETHEGGNQAHNIANVLALTWPHARIAANPYRVVGIDFELDEEGRFLPESLELESLSDLLTLGILDHTTWLRREDIVPHYAWRLYQGQSEVPLDYFKRCIQAGILDKNVIIQLHGCRHGATANGVTTPETFRQIMNLFHRDSDRWDFIRSQVPLETAKAFHRLGITGVMHMKQLYETQVNHEALEQYLADSSQKNHDARFREPSYITVLAMQGIPLCEAITYIDAGLSDPIQINILMTMGIPAQLAQYHHSRGTLFGPMGFFGNAFSSRR